MLDFTTAYDSLSRVFLLDVMRHYGFLDGVVALVDTLHRGTTCVSLVN